MIQPSLPRCALGFRRQARIWAPPNTNCWQTRRSPRTSCFTLNRPRRKSLKAFRSWHRIPFRKTHNLVELGEACCQIDQSLEPLLRRAAPLTEYAWKFRYPGDPEEATAEEAGTALATAREVSAQPSAGRCVPIVRRANVVQEIPIRQKNLWVSSVFGLTARAPARPRAGRRP